MKKRPRKQPSPRPKPNTPEPPRDPGDNPLAIVNKVSEAINARDSLDGVLRRIAKEMVGVTGVKHATITLIDPSGKFYRVKVEEPELIGNLENAILQIEGRPLQEALLENHEPIVVNDFGTHRLGQESPEVRQIAQKIGIKSMLIVPMVHKHEVVGTISVDAIGAPKQFQAEEVDLFKTIANQAAIAIEHARSRDTVANLHRSMRLKEVTARMFAELRSITDFARASIQVFDGSRRILVDGKGFDPNAADDALLMPLNKDELVARIVQQRRVEIVPNTQVAGNLWEAWPGTRSIRSWIGLPLEHEGRVIGLVTLDHDRPGFFGLGLAPRLEQFAGHAAPALDKAYQHDQLQRQFRGAQLLHDVTRIVNTTLDNTTQLLETIAVRMVEILRCARCDVWLMEDEGGRLILRPRVCSNGDRRDQVGLVVRPPGNREASPLLRALHSGSFVVEDALQTYLNPSGTNRRHRPRALVVAPIKIGDQSVGVICASHDKAGWFSDGDRVLLETLALSVGTAIQRHGEMKLISEISNRLIRANEEGPILADIVNGAKTATRTGSGVIFLFDDEATQITAEFVSSGTKHPQPRLDNAQGITRAVIREKKIIFIPETRDDPRVNPVLRDEYRSIIAVPLVGQKIRGVLYLNYPSSHQFTDNEESLLKTLANQAATAIEKARLYQKVKESQTRYESLVGNIPYCLFRKDAISSQFTFVNAAFRDYLQLADNEVVGKTNRDFFDNALAEAFTADDRRVVETKVSVRKTYLLPKRGTVEVLKTPIFNDKKEVCEIQGMFWDVTVDVEQRRRAALAVEAALVEHLPVGILVCNGSGILIANERGRQLLGRDSGELLGHQLDEFVLPDDDGDLLTQLQQSATSSSDGRSLQGVVRANGERIPVAVSARSLPIDGRIEFVLQKEPNRSTK